MNSIVAVDTERPRTGRRPPAAGMGRRKGVPNRVTRAAKEAFKLAFDEIGGVEALAAWARKHRSDFYRLYARLIPVEIAATVLSTEAVVVTDPTDAARVYEQIMGGAIALEAVRFEATGEAGVRSEPQAPSPSGHAPEARSPPIKRQADPSNEARDG